jgi:hypothetical protein
MIYSHRSSSSSFSLLPSSPPKIQTAYEQLIGKLTFGIEKIDSVLKLTTGETVCIVSTDKKCLCYSRKKAR